MMKICSKTVLTIGIFTFAPSLYASVVGEVRDHDLHLVSYANHQTHTGLAPNHPVPEIDQVLALPKTPPISESRLIKRAKGKKPRRWTAEEEERLLQLRKQGMPYAEMLDYFPDRTWRALEDKYQVLTKTVPSGKKAKEWTKKENMLLVKLKEESERRRNPLSWNKIAESLPGRSGEACSNQYRKIKRGRNYEAPVTVHKRFSAEEDERLKSFVKNGTSWEEISTSFPGRTESSLKSRYFYRLENVSQHFWSSEDDDRLIEAVEANMTYEDIRKEIFRQKSVSALKARVTRLRKDGRLTRSARRATKFTSSDFDVMQQLRDQGMRWKDIEREYFPGRGVSSVSQFFRIHRRRNKNRNEKDEEK